MDEETIIILLLVKFIHISTHEISEMSYFQSSHIISLEFHILSANVAIILRKTAGRNSLGYSAIFPHNVG